MLFDGPPAELPIATLMPGALPARRYLAGALARWLAERAAWIAPRTIPLAVAALGLIATLGAVKYAGEWARCDDIRLGVHTRSVASPPSAATTEIVVRPLGLHDRYLIIAVDLPAAR